MRGNHVGNSAGGGFRRADKVTGLVAALEARGVEVFYDFNESARLWGKDLELELAQIYAQEARFMVLCLSASYPVKDWTRFELEIGKRASRKRPSEYILPLHLAADIPTIVGLKDTIGFQTMLSQGDVDRIAELLLSKVTRWEANVSPEPPLLS